MPVTTEGQVQDQELLGSWFGVEIEGLGPSFFSDVGGLAVDIEVVEKTDTAADTVTRKRPGTTKYNELSLKRTLGPDKTFWEWAKSIRDGSKEYRKNGSVIVYDIAGDQIGRWEFTNAWPSKWSASDLDVGSDDLMEEEVTLQIEILVRTV